MLCFDTDFLIVHHVLEIDHFFNFGDFSLHFPLEFSFFVPLFLGLLHIVLQLHVFIFLDADLFLNGYDFLFEVVALVSHF